MIRQHQHADSGHHSVSHIKQSVPLLDPKEIERVSENKLIIFMTGKNPIIADKNWYMESNRYQRCIALNKQGESQ